MGLCLTRRKNEAVCIGEDVMVTIAEVSGGKVRLLIDAPRQIVIARKEILGRFKGGRRDKDDRKDVLPIDGDSEGNSQR